MTDDEFLAALEGDALPAGAFDHAAHVRAAYLYLRRRGFVDGMAAFRASLRRFAERHGAAGKYHETITVAFLAVIHERLHAGAADEDWPGFAARNRDLFAGDFLDRYYRRETLASPLAREVFLLEERR
jgi:hypothetical protein